MSKKYNIENYVTKKQIKLIKKVIDNNIGDIDTIYDRIENILSNHKAIGLGTNRIVFIPDKKSKYVIKVAGDSHGIEANYREFYNADLDPKRMTKSYSITEDGVILIQERVKTMDSKTMEKRKHEVRDMLHHLEDKVLLVDCKLSNFKNFGIRHNGDIVLLDHGDTLPLIDYNTETKAFSDTSNVSLRCKCVSNEFTKNPRPCDGKLKYSKNYDYFICKKCGVKTSINDAYKEFYAYARLGEGDKFLEFNDDFDLKKYAKKVKKELNDNMKKYAKDRMDGINTDNDVNNDNLVHIDLYDVDIPEPNTMVGKLLFSSLVNGNITLENYCDRCNLNLDDIISNKVSEEYKNDDNDSLDDEFEDDGNYDDDDYDDENIDIDPSDVIEEEDDIIEIVDDEFDTKEDSDQIIESFDDSINEENNDLKEVDETEYDELISYLINRLETCRVKNEYHTCVIQYKSTPLQRYACFDLSKIDEFKNYHEISDMYKLNDAAKKNKFIYYSFFDGSKFYIAPYKWFIYEKQRSMSDMIRYFIRMYSADIHNTVHVPKNDMIKVFEDVEFIKHSYLSCEDFIHDLESYVYVISENTVKNTYDIQLNDITGEGHLYSRIIYYITSDTFYNMLSDSICRKSISLYLQSYIVYPYTTKVQDSYSVLIDLFIDFIDLIYSYTDIENDDNDERTMEIMSFMKHCVTRFHDEVTSLFNSFDPDEVNKHIESTSNVTDIYNIYYDDTLITEYNDKLNYQNKSIDTEGSLTFIGYNFIEFYEIFIRKYINRVILYLFTPVLKKMEEDYMFKDVIINKMTNDFHNDYVILFFDKINAYIHANPFLNDLDNEYICNVSILDKTNVKINVNCDFNMDYIDNKTSITYDMGSIITSKAENMKLGENIKIY